MNDNTFFLTMYMTIIVSLWSLMIEKKIDKIEGILDKKCSILDTEINGTKSDWRNNLLEMLKLETKNLIIKNKDKSNE